MGKRFIGKSLSRADGKAKVTGAAKYTAENSVNNLTYGVFALSTIPNGRITKIDTCEAEKVTGVIKILGSGSIRRES